LTRIEECLVSRVPEYAPTSGATGGFSSGKGVSWREKDSGGETAIDADDGGDRGFLVPAANVQPPENDRMHIGHGQAVNKRADGRKSPAGARGEGNKVGCASYPGPKGTHLVESRQAMVVPGLVEVQQRRQRGRAEARIEFGQLVCFH